MLGKQKELRSSFLSFLLFAVTTSSTGFSPEALGAPKKGLERRQGLPHQAETYLCKQYGRNRGKDYDLVGLTALTECNLTSTHHVANCDKNTIALLKTMKQRKLAIKEAKVLLVSGFNDYFSGHFLVEYKGAILDTEYANTNVAKNRARGGAIPPVPETVFFDVHCADRRAEVRVIPAEDYLRIHDEKGPQFLSFGMYKYEKEGSPKEQREVEKLFPKMRLSDYLGWKSSSPDE